MCCLICHFIPTIERINCKKIVKLLEYFRFSYPRQTKNKESINVQPSCITRFILSRIELKLSDFINMRSKVGMTPNIFSCKQLHVHQFLYFIEWQPTWQLTLAYRKCIHYTLLACVTYSFFWIHLKEQIIDKWTWIVWFHMWHVAKSLFFVIFDFWIWNPSDTTYHFHYPY